jgi:ABC-type enterochelin transport system substrate-binding protein
MMRKIIYVLGAAAFVLTAAASFAQQPQTVRVRGTIEAADGPLLTVKTREGDTVKVKVADDIKIVAIVKASLSDIKPGSFVGSAAMPEENGHWKAVEVHIFPESMRGTGEGDRPFDYKPKSTMTNGTVAPTPSAKSAMTNGTVGSAESQAGATTLTINYKDGEKKIDVTPDTPIVTYVPGTKDELKAGAKIYITAATKDADGTLTTPRINVGRGLAPPM